MAQKRAHRRAVPIMLRFLLSGLDKNCCIVVKLSIYIPSSAPKQAPNGEGNGFGYRAPDDGAGAFPLSLQTVHGDRWEARSLVCGRVRDLRARKCNVSFRGARNRAGQASDVARPE